MINTFNHFSPIFGDIHYKFAARKKPISKHQHFTVWVIIEQETHKMVDCNTPLILVIKTHLQIYRNTSQAFNIDNVCIFISLS
jgi:hypothetical protein